MIEEFRQHELRSSVSGTQLTIDQPYDHVFRLPQTSPEHVTRDPSEQRPRWVDYAVLLQSRPNQSAPIGW
jgi:hypothetical protein